MLHVIILLLLSILILIVNILSLYIYIYILIYININVKYNSACLLGRPVSSGNAAKCKRILPRKPQEISGDVLGTGQQPLLLRSGGVM